MAPLDQVLLLLLTNTTKSSSALTSSPHHQPSPVQPHHSFSTLKYKKILFQSPPLPAMPLSDLLASLASPAPLPPFLARLHSVLLALDQTLSPETPAFSNAVDSLASELCRTVPLLCGPIAVPTQFRDLGRCLGLLLLACADAPAQVRDAMAALHREMMAARFEAHPDTEDVVLRVKSGTEEELAFALLELGFLIEQGILGDGEENLIQVLLNRLSTVKNGNRLKIISVLRSLASKNDVNKERMSSMGALTAIVQSLSRDADERREAVGLLVDLCAVLKVRQKIGRVQGCIVMLVALLNGEDEGSSLDAGMLLGVLSNNTQNVLLMAEAGFFVPLVQYLKEGSDMNKILMATAISRMELTDQMKISLGEEGSIEPLVKMFTSGKLEAKMSSLEALRNLSTVNKNMQSLINAGILTPLLQLLFSVTSVLMTLREPASAILASIAQSELILIHKNVAQQILSLLTLSSPTIQLHLLQALYSISGHSNALKARAKLRENGAVQLLLPFLTDSHTEVKMAALNLLFHLSKDFKGDMTEQLGETHLNTLVEIISTSTLENEKAAAVGILSNLPVVHKQATEILLRANLLPILISLLEVGISTSSTPTRIWLLESIAGVFRRFTLPLDKKLQRVSAANGIIPCLLKLLSSGSYLAKSRAATSLAQLSQNSLALSKIKKHRWFCVPPSETVCEVHNGFCTVKTTFCLVKAGVIPPLVQILNGKEREADEAVLNALATLMQDEIWENGSNAIEKASGVQALIRVLELGSLKAQVKAVWMLERIFRLGTYRGQYGEAAQVMLVDLAQNGDPTLKLMVGTILAHLQLLQMQSSYF